MSKAFTRESDDLPERPVRLRPSSPLPLGTKNYLTAHGERQLREELNRLEQVEKPRLVRAAETQDEHVKQELRNVDDRIGYLEQTLRTASICHPNPAARDTVLFGATVRVRNSQGELEVYRIVGVDEVDLDRGWISWLSPIGKALLNAKVGGTVRFRTPAGEQELEIVDLSYLE